jgi:hypothetical protein
MIRSGHPFSVVDVPRNARMSPSAWKSASTSSRSHLTQLRGAMMQRAARADGAANLLVTEPLVCPAMARE